MEKLDTSLLAILLSNCRNSYYVHNLRYLLNADVLNKNEEKLCYNILKQIEIYGHTNVPTALKELSYSLDDVENCEILNYASMYTYIDELIQHRRDEENNLLMQEALVSTSPQLYTGKMLETFFNRYASNITVEEDQDYEILEEPEYIPEPKTISSANEYIDALTGGLEAGSVTTVVGTYDYHKSLWAINIAYKCLKEQKNVLYISLGTKRIDVYKRFLSRHSCDSKFGSAISVEDMTPKHDSKYGSIINENSIKPKFDKRLYDRVYTDFDALFRDYLVVFDDSECIVNSHYNLQKLMVYAQKKFLEKSGKGIELIVIDDFSNIKLDNGKRSITNRSTIINEYYKYLINQANNLLGTNEKINVVITIHAINNFDYFFANCIDFTLEFIDEEVNVLSDYIFTIYADKDLEKSNNAKLKVLKSYTKTMEESKSEVIDFQHWHLKYAKDNNDDEAAKDTKIQVLEEENERLMEDVLNQGQQIMNMLTNNTVTTEELSLEEALKDCGPL